MNEHTTRISLPRYSECFVCGERNPAGLSVTFFYRAGSIQADFTPTAKHAGYRGVSHGGVLAALLDECMGWTSILSRPVMCVSVELTFRYRAPARVDEALRVIANLKQDKRRMVFAEGRIERLDGTVVCEGEGKFVPIPDEEMNAIFAYANWKDDLSKTHERIKADLDRLRDSSV